MLRSKFPALAVCLMLALIGFAPSKARADLAAMTRTLESVESPLGQAISDAEAGRLRQLSQSLKTTQDKWRAFYIGYRSWGAGVDSNWISDVDAVQTEFMNATNAVTPGNNAPLAASSLTKIRDLLDGLRERNEVPDVQEATKNLNDSLKSLQTEMKSLEGKALSPSNLVNLKDQFEDVGDTWQTLQKVLLDVNALGLSDGDLASLRSRMERQNQLIEALKSASANANLSAGIASIQSATEGLQSLADQWRDANAESDGDGVESDPKGRLNFP